MGGCCLVVLLLLISPRLFLVGVWLMSNWYIAFDSKLVAFLGWLFLPYTSLAWMYIFFHNGGRLEGGYLVLSTWPSCSTSGCSQVATGP